MAKCASRVLIRAKDSSDTSSKSFAKGSCFLDDIQVSQMLTLFRSKCWQTDWNMNFMFVLLAVLFFLSDAWPGV
ncbi:MAG: hypothetical protein A2W80_04590 [Candidatus Riflebacteria bacterium GWC2_50_8]|nr:MAG: hypothetical protein A2W80_04590 [Candidatus Riflebacteria bacterium GWC2_50_8]